MKKFFILAAFTALFAACNGGEKPAADAQKAEEAAKAGTTSCRCPSRRTSCTQRATSSLKRTSQPWQSLNWKICCRKRLKRQIYGIGHLLRYRNRRQRRSPYQYEQSKGTLSRILSWHRVWLVLFAQSTCRISFTGRYSRLARGYSLVKPGGKGKFVIHRVWHIVNHSLLVLK